MAAGAAVPPLPTTTTVTLTSLSSTAVPPPILAPFPPATTTLPVPVVPSQPSLLSVVTQQHSTSTQFAIVAPARVTQPATAEIVNVRDRAYLGAYGGEFGEGAKSSRTETSCGRRRPRPGLSPCATPAIHKQLSAAKVGARHALGILLSSAAMARHAAFSRAPFPRATSRAERQEPQ